MAADVVQGAERRSIRDDDATRRGCQIERALPMNGAIAEADELVAASADGTDVALGTTVVAQCVTSSFDSTRQGSLRHEATAPDGVQKLGLRHEPLMIGH